MGFNENIQSRQGLLESMIDVDTKQFLFLRHLWATLGERLGVAGSDLMLAGLRQFGHWRGEYIRFRGDTLVRGATPTTLIDNWDGCDLALAGARTQLTVQVVHSAVITRFTTIPGGQEFDRDGAALLRQYWRVLCEGIAAGFAPDISAEVRFGDPSADMEIVWTGNTETAVAEPEDVVERVLGDSARAIEQTRRASMNNGALYMFVAREVIRRYDAAGETAIRAAVRSIGRERAQRLKRKHEEEGKEPSLRTLMEDWDGPLVSVWTWRNEGYLSEGLWHQDCVWCPYAAAWQEFGAEGLSLGHLYDVELHTALYSSYLPDVIVRWEELKTRGDPVCKFRFSVPSLMTDSERRQEAESSGDAVGS